MYILRIVDCMHGGSLSLKQPFSLHLLLFYYYPMVNLLIQLFVVLFGTVSVLVLLTLPQDPNNRSSAAQTIEDGVCASPRIATSYNFLVGKVPEGSQEYPLLSLRSSSSFLCPLPRLPVTSIPPFIFPSITRCRRQFLRKM